MCKNQSTPVYLKWTDDFCKEVLQVLSEYPGNLTLGFEQCSKRFGGSPRAYKSAWYTSGTKLNKMRKDNNTIICLSLNRGIRNYKNIPRNSCSKANKVKPTLAFLQSWKHRLKAFFS